ncbi:MAG: DNA primase [Desulfovibrionaceae bacterium]|nr:DNA primase [Desulfovibrionaceae bacterium]MBO4793110.1 DNA primase [Deltaproteobacteria bacterium]
MSQRTAVQEIKARLNIVDVVRRYVELKRNGSRWVAPCPFHQETKPSFSVNEEEGFFYCFGCQASGDLFDFYGRINGLDFRETLEALAEEAGVALDKWQDRGGPHAPRQSPSEKQQMLRLHEIAAAHFAGNLASEAGRECRDYMQKRGISPEIAQAFGLGWSRRDWRALTDTLSRAGFAPETGVRAALLSRSERSGRVFDRFRGRFMFPIRSLSGHVVAFGGRIIADEDEAKYINSSDSPLYKKGEHLYGLSRARRAIAAGAPAMLTEGYMDVVTLHQFGYGGAVGVLGTALTPEQVKRLSGFTSRVELLFDGDRAGRKAALRSAEMFLARGLRCKVVLFPEKDDIDSLLRTQGKDCFERLRAQAPEGLDFCVQALQEMAPREAVEWSRAFLAKIEQPELISGCATALANGLGLSEAELREQAAAARQSAPARPSQGAPADRHARNCDRELMTFAVRYPQALPRLRELGARLFLTAPWSRELWDKMEQHPPDEAFRLLNEKEKAFWVRCRTGDAPPLNNEDGEFAAIKTMLSRFQLAGQQASVTAALRQGAGKDDFEADMEYLRALQETLEKTHGKQH